MLPWHAPWATSRPGRSGVFGGSRCVCFFFGLKMRGFMVFLICFCVFLVVLIVFLKRFLITLVDLVFVCFGGGWGLLFIFLGLVWFLFCLVWFYLGLSD